jgi:hypothetical protein
LWNPIGLKSRKIKKSTQTPALKFDKKGRKITPKELIKKGSVRKPIKEIKWSPLEEFGNIDYLHPVATEALDKARNDLRESIQKTLRIQQAFLKLLNKQAPLSDRVKFIIRETEEISYFAEVQRHIVEKKISKILAPKNNP